MLGNPTVEAAGHTAISECLRHHISAASRLCDDAHVDETLRSGESISILARRHGVAPNLLYRWRRLMTEGGGGGAEVQADDAVICLKPTPLLGLPLQQTTELAANLVGLTGLIPA